jgi:VWFA-related protein
MTTRRTTPLLLSAFLVLVSIGVLSGSPSQAPTFKGENRTVAVYATVTDSQGRLVPDLPSAAFTVLDERRPQPLTIFVNEIQPITVVVLLDRSGSMRRNFQIEEEAAEQFVAAMQPADKSRIGSFSNFIQLDPRDFTSDHEELTRILRHELQEEGPTPLWNAVNVGITSLLHQKGRRVILVFTDGVDSPLNFRSNNSTLKDVMKRAEEENVMVYAIGLAGDNHGGYAPRPGGGGGFGGRGGFGRGGFGRGGGGYASRAAVNEKPDEGLPKIAAATGGGYFELTSTADLGATFKRVADELHHQYALGFTPEKLDGKMHALEVRVSDNGMTARARRSYLAERE